MSNLTIEVEVNVNGMQARRILANAYKKNTRTTSITLMAYNRIVHSEYKGQREDLELISDGVEFLRVINRLNGDVLMTVAL